MIDHSDCREGQDNPDCPTGLHTRVPLWQMGAMLQRKAQELRERQWQAGEQDTEG